MGNNDNNIDKNHNSSNLDNEPNNISDNEPNNNSDNNYNGPQNRMPDNDDNNDYIDMKPLFYPKTIAVIGVSKNKVSGMKFVFANQVSGYMDSGGKVYPINPKYKELYGFRVYPSLFDKEVPDIDLAIIAVPAKFVPQVVLDCGKKKVKFVVIFTSGFGESGKEDNQKALEAAVKEAREKHNTRFIGPNCLGIDNPYSKVSYYPGMPTGKGNISYVSMSGGMTGRLSNWLVSQGQGFHNIVSIGNCIDLTPADFVNYFREDPLTDVIALYMESIPDGRRFIEAVKKTTPKKPIVLFKGGQTEIGSKAARSHTGGLAGSNEIWDAMCKQFGVIRATHFEEFADFVSAFAIKYKLPEDRNVGILVCGGGIAVEYADLCVKHGLNVAPLSPETKKKLGEVVPDVNTSFENPVDLGEYGYVPQNFTRALEVLAEDPNISSILFVREAERFKIFQQVLGIPNMEELTIQLLKKALLGVKKTAFCSTSANGQKIEDYEARYNFKKNMIHENLPVIDYIPNACELIKKMVDYKHYIDRNKED